MKRNDAAILNCLEENKSDPSTETARIVQSISSNVSLLFKFKKFVLCFSEKKLSANLSIREMIIHIYFEGHIGI